MSDAGDRQQEQLAGFRARRYPALDKSGWLWDFHSQRRKGLRGIAHAAGSWQGRGLHLLGHCVPKPWTLERTG